MDLVAQPFTLNYYFEKLNLHSSTLDNCFALLPQIKQAKLIQNSFLYL